MSGFPVAVSAQRLGVSQPTVHRLIKGGCLRWRQPGLRVVQVAASDVDARLRPSVGASGGEA